MLERIHARENFDGSPLLAIIVRNEYRPAAGVAFHTDRGDSLQLASMRWPCGHKVKPHSHKKRSRVASVTQEVLLIRDGTVELSIYDDARTLVATRILFAGDTAILLAGGHSLMLLSDAHIMEVKSGPYTTREEDKDEWQAT